MRRDIDGLMERLERVKQAWADVPEPDDLSISLWQLEREMSALDTEGIAALAAEMDEDGRQILTPEQAWTFAQSFVR